MFQVCLMSSDIYGLVETSLISLDLQCATHVLRTSFKQHRASAKPILRALVSSYLRKCEGFINVGSNAHMSIKRSSMLPVSDQGIILHRPPIQPLQLILSNRLMNSYFVHTTRRLE